MLEKILALVFPPRPDETAIANLSPADFCLYLSPESVYLEDLEIEALLPFRDEVVRAAIHEAKYRGTSKARVLLSAVLSEYLTELDDYRNERIVLVPVPLGKERERERGFNQVEEIVKRAAKELSIPMDTKLLVRTRETLSQVTLPREKRRQNMKGAFRATKDPDPRYLYIVVDDVTTTGATLEAATKALRDAGATQVAALALAH